MKRFNWIVSALAVAWALAWVIIVFLFGAVKVEEFINMVTNLRKVQRAYFKDRKHGDMLEAKRLEKLVDQALADGIAIPVEAVLDNRAEGSDQIGLFE